MPNYNGIDYLIEPLSKSTKKAKFDCGIEVLNRYLKQQANQDKRKYVATPFVAVEKKHQEIIGYYTLSATSLKLQDLPSSLVRKLPKYPVLPAILLGRLAINNNYQKYSFVSFNDYPNRLFLSMTIIKKLFV